jgi:hypothetical protein
MHVHPDIGDDLVALFDDAVLFRADPRAIHFKIDYYGDEGIVSKNAPIPLWLKFNYVFWIVWGLIWFYFFWNGSTG